MQAVVAVWAAVEGVVNDTGGCLARASTIVLTRALLAWRLGFSGLGRVWFDEGGWVALLLLQFSDTRQSESQLLLELSNKQPQFSILSAELGVLFLKCHGARIPQS